MVGDYLYIRVLHTRPISFEKILSSKEIIWSEHEYELISEYFPIKAQ